MHLRRIRSHPEFGPVKYDKVLQDMLQVEFDNNFKMLPDIARNEENTKPFTHMEKCIDIVENGKYNKKDAH